ncbi:MAG: class I SAM-dependent methyltransferase [Acidobacteriota bacterium]|nr:class I SAM-dependent methyltransferase [Acidobacteriota bacterium]
MIDTGPLSFYHDRNKAEDYIEMRRGIDGRILVSALRSLIADGSRVLELGIGPGTDLRILAEFFEVVGSDYSPWFLEIFSTAYPGIDLLRLDAVTIETDLAFDCIFSNKVLHHLPEEQMKRSLERQARVVGKGGILFHSFWLGDESSTCEGLTFTKYPEEKIASVLSNVGEIVKSGRYQEMNLNDSFFAAVRITEQC